MNSQKASRCPCCNIGYLREKRTDYTETVADGVKVTAPNLLVEECDHCGEIALPANSATELDHAIAEHTEQLDPRELERIRDDIGVGQTEMSEILGLGGKTYHRWEKGHQFPSRSMGFYLRILAEFPEVFNWLKERGWRLKNRTQGTRALVDLGSSFPYLSPSKIAEIKRSENRHNPAMALLGKR